MLNKLMIGKRLILTFLVMALLVLITGVTGLYFTGIVGNSGEEVGIKYAPLGDAAMEIKLSATKAHLLFEEIMSGDTSEDINEVWSLLDESDWFTDAILKGGENEEGTFYATEDPVVRKKAEKVKSLLADFVTNAHKRYEESKSNAGDMAAGSQADAEFDEAYEAFIELADEAEEVIHDTMDAGMEMLRSDISSAKKIIATFYDHSRSYCTKSIKVVFFPAGPYRSMRCCSSSEVCVDATF